MQTATGSAHSHTAGTRRWGEWDWSEVTPSRKPSLPGAPVPLRTTCSPLEHSAALSELGKTALSPNRSSPCLRTWRGEQSMGWISAATGPYGHALVVHNLPTICGGPAVTTFSLWLCTLTQQGVHRGWGPMGCVCDLLPPAQDSHSWR